MYSIADDILIVGYDVGGKDNDRMVRLVMQIYCQDKCCFRSVIVQFLGEMV